MRRKVGGGLLLPHCSMESRFPHSQRRCALLTDSEAKGCLPICYRHNVIILVLIPMNGLTDPEESSSIQIGPERVEVPLHPHILYDDNREGFLKEPLTALSGNHAAIQEES